MSKLTVYALKEVKGMNIELAVSELMEKVRCHA